MLCPVSVFVSYVSRDGCRQESHFDEWWVWRSILLSSRYVQQRLLLVGESASVPLSKQVIFLHQHQDRSRSFQFKGSLLKKKVSFSLAPISLVFQASTDFAFCQMFLETATLLDFFFFFLFFFSKPDTCKTFHHFYGLLLRGTCLSIIVILLMSIYPCVKFSINVLPWGKLWNCLFPPPSLDWMVLLLFYCWKFTNLIPHKNKTYLFMYRYSYSYIPDMIL